MDKVQLKKLLEAKGHTLSGLAAKAGVNKSTVSRWADKKVPAERVGLVSQLTGIPKHKIRPDLFEPDRMGVQ